ncbi:MAG TPA: DUF6776 family protein [Rhodanobacteraceae bacterium]|jgi:hypothetical protein|nr:DUF6776 family protein [Rhodanobacteraceae bacterium]
MPRVPPPLVVRPHDPARARRGQLLVGAIWLVSLVVVAALTTAIVSYGFESASRSRSSAAEHDAETLKARIATLERSEKVAKAAVGDLQQTLRDREEEIESLRSDLAFYGRLVGGGKREGLAVHVFKIRRVAGSQAWNFVATLTQNFKRGQDTKGRLTLSVEGVEGGKLATLDWALLTQGQDPAGIEYGFKYFQQVNGTIMLPGGFEANRVRVRADGDAGRVEQDFAWSDAIKGEEGGDVR